MANLATGDNQAAAQNIVDSTAYRMRNPGMPEGKQLGEAWESGNGILGGIEAVGGEIAKDWREAPNTVDALKGAGRNVRAMGEGIVEQVPNMLAPTMGMVAGGAAGSYAGSVVPGVGTTVGALTGAFLGSSAGNALVEGQEIAMSDLQKSGVDVSDINAISQHLQENSNELLKKAGIKGSVIGVVDTAMTALTGGILNKPARMATFKILGEMGVDLTDKAAVKTAMGTEPFKQMLLNDAAYQASQKGVKNVARNVTAAALDPIGEGAGEYLGTGLATGDYDAKNAALEAFSSVGQSGAMFAGQKAYQRFTRPQQAEGQPGQPQESPAPPQANPSAPDQAPFPTQEPPPPYTETAPGPETLQPPAPPVPAPGPISRAADMLARTTPGIMGKVMDPALAPLPEDNLAGEWNAQEQQALAGNQARNFTQAEQAAYDLEQQRQTQQAEELRKADPLAAQKAAFEESYNAMGTVPESMGNITPDDAAAFERKVELERATNRRQQYIKAWKQAEQEADTLTRDPEIPAAVKREARKQVREIVKADPVYEQMNEVKKRGGLNLEAMGQDYDRDTVNIINRRYPGIFSRVGSVKPDDFANEMGYDDLDAMVRRFSEARTQKELTASILKEKTDAWQNAESEQQAHAAKQAERKQGAEWAGAQGAGSVSRGIPARTVFPAPDEAVSAMESMIRRKPENFKEEDFDHWTYTAEQQGRLKQAYREAVNGGSGNQDQNSEAASGDRLYQNDLLERTGGVQDGVKQTSGAKQSFPRVDREGPTGAGEEFVGRGNIPGPKKIIRGVDGERDQRDLDGRRDQGSGRGKLDAAQGIPGNGDNERPDSPGTGEKSSAGKPSSAITSLVEENIQPGEKVSRAGVVVQNEVAAIEPLPRDIGATQPARMERDTGEYLQGQRERRDFYKGNAAVTEADTQNFIRDQQGRRSFQGVDNTPQSVAGNPSEFLRDQGIRRDAVGKVSEPMRRQPGESTRDFIKRRKAGKEAADVSPKEYGPISVGDRFERKDGTLWDVTLSGGGRATVKQVGKPKTGDIPKSHIRRNYKRVDVNETGLNEPQADLSPTDETQTRTDSLTNRIANVADQQSNKDVIVDKTIDKTAAKSADKKGATVKESLTVQPQTSTQGESNGKEVEKKAETRPQWAENHAKEVGGKVVYHDNEVALIEGFSMTGKLVYSGVSRKRDSRTRVGISAYTGDLFMAEQKQRLVDAEKNARKMDEQQHNDAPDGPFAGKGKFATSENTPIWAAEFTDNLLKMLAVDARVYLTTMDDAKSATNFHGPFAAIRSASVTSDRTLAETRQLPNGDMYIVFRPTSGKTLLLETLAHEVGHIVEKTAWKEATDSERAAVLEDFRAWRDRKGIPAREWVNSMRALRSARNTTVPAGVESDDMTPYWKSFSEYFADQVSRWAVSSDKPLSVVEIFFKKIAVSLRRIYASLSGEMFLPAASMRAYLDKRSAAFIYMREGAGADIVAESKKQQLEGNVVDKTVDKRADKSAAEKSVDSEFAGNKVFTANKVEAARARLKAKRGSLSSGFDPELMQDMLIIGGAHFESGIRKFSSWSKAVLADIGEEFKPFLRGTYENLRHYPGIEKDGMSTAAEIEGIDLDAIGKQADNAGKEQSQPAAETNKEATDVQANSQSVPAREQLDRTETAPGRGEGSGVSADAGAELSGTGRPNRQADDGKPSRRSDRTGKGAQYGADDRKGGVDERHGGISEQPVASSSSPQNYRITEADRLGKGGAKQKARDNIKAIRILKQLSQESRPATTDEQAQLVKYVGWGASELANGVFPQKKYEPASRRYVDSYKDDWKSIGEELRAALTDEEYNAAKASTINAHYTSEKIIKGMYAALERFGYTGKGKALEPGSGVGHFIGLLPDAFTAGTRFTTVEMDPISAGIAKALYPGHDVRQADFTKFKAPDNFFDIAIGNPPFADIEIVSDHDYAEKKFKLHDYFFAKSIDKVRPGGLMVLVTSRYTMDKGNDKARSYLAKRADLLGAIRLPQTAFKENAGTEVVTDVLFLRKRLEGERPAGQAWGRLEPVQAGDKKIHVNEYFASHPEMVLGKHSTAGSMYGPGQYTVDPNKGDIAEQFAQAVANLPENVYQADKSSPAPTDNQTIEAEWSPQSVKEGAFYLDDKGELRQKENGMGSPVVGMVKKKAVIKDFVRIRDAVRQVLYVQLKDEGDLAVAQQELGDAYDAFVAAHGPINKTTEVATTNKATGKESVSYRYPNFSHFKADPDAYLIAAIEKYDDSTHKAEKTDIFTKRVISPPAEPRVESLVDALHVSLHQTGEVDVPLIAKMMGVDEDTAIEGLSGAIYLDPNGNRWVTADEYLSGNVRRKLSAARAAADIEPKYTENVTALEAVQPQDLPPSRIKVSLGMPIIQAEDVESFAAEVMQMGIAVRHIAATGTWDVTKRSGYQTLVATNDYGTNRLDAADLIDAALNNRTVKVYDRDSDGKQVFNRDATEAAFAKLQNIRERFSQWAWEDAGRSTLLARKFNDLYNNTVKREYGGDHIKQMRFPGMSAVITPHEHQKRVAWRIVQRGNTYMAHSVGAGKTIGSIIAGMELKRLGIKKKPMWVVPNHMLKQFSSEFQQLYPAAKLLVADEEQFAKGNRNRFMGRIAAENWDGIIITHSAFGKIPVSEEYQREFIGEQIAELEDMMADADDDRTKTKQLERQKKRLEQRLERILNNASKDKGVSFEESGIDQLFVDEAHQFRKLDFVTNQTSISGIDPNGSLMAFDLYVKTRYLETLYPGRSMVMMSGTPVTNTIGEVYTIQRFLSEPALRELDIHNFDAWAATFGESVTELVATPAGTYQPKTRFGRFRNMPSLAGMWGEIGDFVHAKDLPYLKRPMVDGGGRKMIIGQSSDIQKAYKQSLAARIKAIKERKGPPQKGDDILLTVITDGRHAALDERFIAPEANPRKDAKLEMLVDKVHGIWDESAEKRSTQMIFADLGLPQAESTRGFSVYKHIKQELMRRGVPEAEIAFMQDYKKSDEKQKLFKAMNNGDVRVLIGSSAAMGTGVNAQRKLVALHHFDPDTYLPSNIEQREGRIVRQGNENEQVQLYVYLTRGSYDETMWQFIESKQRFIDQFLAGSVTEDTVEDIDGAANQYAEARAMSSDNPLVLELAGLENDISKLESLRRAHVDGQVRMARDRSAWKSRIGTIEKLLPTVEAAAKARVDTKGERFAMNVLGKNYKARADAGEKLIGLLKSQAARPVMVEAHDIGEIAGFTLKARSNTLDPRDMVFTLWHGKTELQGKVEDRYNKIAIENGLEKEPSPSGLVMRLENLARGVDERLEDLKDELAKAEHVIKEADNRMGAKFEQLDALEGKRARADEIRVQLEREGSDNQESTGPGEQDVKLSKSTSSITPSSTPADIRAEVSAKLGKFRTMQLMRRGVLNVVATQGEAKRIIGEAGAKLSAAAHYSPHSFDKFSTGHIGSGEGNQAYGYGLYFFTAEEVGAHYKKLFTTHGLTDEDNKKSEEVWKYIVENHPNDAKEIKEQIDSSFANSTDKPSDYQYGYDSILVGLNLGSDNVPDGLYDDTIDNLQKVVEKFGIKYTKNAKRYEVELSPQEDEYLLWDKPLSEQSEKVKAALKRAEVRTTKIVPDAYNDDGTFDINKLDWDKEVEFNGDEFYGNIIAQTGSQKAASEYLHSLGIRGIKYLDGTSRSKGEGTFNYVIFDENDVEIQVKYSKDGAIQGFALDGKLHLVADGIPSGNAFQVFLHEITHLTRLGLNSNANFKRLLDTIERHKGQDTALGEAIAAAEARIPADTNPEYRAEEILAYLIENDRTDVGIVRRFIAMVKKVLVNMGVSPDIFSKEDFKALAVNAAKWQSTMATGGNVMRSVREMFKPVDPNSPALKRWQGNSQLTEPVFHGSPKEFWTFDKNRVGKNTTSPGSGLGFFFATNRAESQGYAGPSGSLRSFYVKAENPKYMNASDLPKFRGVDEAQAYAKRQQLAGYDSIVLEDEGHVIVFEPNQVKSAEINTGAFDAGNDDVRYSVAGGGSGITGNGPGPVWATPQDSKTDSFIYNAQDKLIDMKRIQDNIEKALGPIQEQHDVRMAEELYHKRAAKRVEDVLVAEVNPLMKELGAIPSADLSEFEEYMHALHAPEANESLRQRNPNEQELKAIKEAAKADRDNLQQSAIVRRFIDKERELAAAERDVEAGDADDSLIAVINDELESLRDEPIVGKYIKARDKHRKLRNAQPFGGDNTALSGMSNEAAETLLANIPAAKLRKYKVLAAKWRRFMDKTRDTLVQYELESQETVDSWAEAFENYVPLHREDMENGMGIGQGFSVKGSATRSRTGSNRKVVDIIAHIVAQRERAIVRGEKAAISRALYGLAAANPNPDVWTIETPPVVREFDPVTGLVVSRPDPMYKNKPNAVVHRFIDEKGHVEERAVLFNEQSERGMRLAQALKNLDTEQLGAILRTSAVLTRWFSAINTQYNLVFGPVNAIRDAGSAMLHLTDTPLAGRQTQVAKRIATGIKPLFKAIWAEASGTPLDTDIAKAWHELQIEGGTTGFRDMFENAEERAEELKRAMLSTTKSRFAAKLRWAKQQVSQYNDVMENCTRLAVYMESRDQGLSKAKSASLAKNITLNFNRKGKVASQAGAMYAFFNASIQGTEKMYRTMTGPAGKKILAGGLLLGASQAVLLAAAGFGDDEPPEFIKERAIIIPVGGKKYVTIPMPLGFNIIPNVARVATEWMLSGGKDTGERVTGLIGSFAETFNPIGNAGFSVQTIAPTVIDPLVALSENKDWTGKPIAKQNFNTLKPTPGHERMKDTASAVGIGLSRLLNFLSGGTEYTPGSLSPTPDQIDYLIGQAFGGVGRESLKAAQVVGTMYTGEDLPVYKIPLVSRFYGDSADSSAASTAFYRNVKRMNVHAAEIEGLAENRGDIAGYMADHPEAKYVRRTEATYRRVQKLQKAKRTLLKNDAPRAKVEAVEKSISSLMAAYNMVVEER